MTMLDNALTTIPLCAQYCDRAWGESAGKPALSFFPTYPLSEKPYENEVGSPAAYARPHPEHVGPTTSLMAIVIRASASADVSYKDGMMRTIAYIDGHNLYFSCLKRTPYKWLDLECLLAPIIAAAAPGSELIAVKYFTSPIKGALSKHGRLSTDAQAEYLRALRANPRVEVVEGRFSVESAHALRHVIPPDISDRIEIWKIEEKETDVSLAVSMYADASSGFAEQIVLVSNDSDMVPALRAIRSATDVQVGVILPIRRSVHDPLPGRRPSVSLGKHAHWLRDHILDDELMAAQMPVWVTTRRRPARRPSHW